MAPGSTKDVVKAINSYIPNSTLPLPDDLLEVIESYLEKHLPIDDSDAQKIHEELLAIYQKDVQDQPQRYTSFIAVLRQMKPAIEGYKRLLQWWDILVIPVLDHLGNEKGLAAETRLILLEILAYDNDNDEAKKADAEKTSAVLTSRLLEMWLKKSAKPDADSGTKFLHQQIHTVLIEYGRKRPKELLTAMNKFFIQKKYRAQVLALLGEFIRYGPPHLYQLLQTPLWPSLLRCLEVDTSTTVISLAMTVLVMLLPHIPNSVVKYLPNLFKIYSRLLFWERERGPSITDAIDPEKQGKQDDSDSDDDDDWEILQYSSDWDEEMVPEILSFFTFLYGLYPINFMSYIRKPERYLRHANYDDSDDMDVQPSEVRQRSEPFRRVHLLHSNFFTMTLKSEVNDPNRWMRSEAADVTATCMALYCGPPDRVEALSMNGHAADRSAMGATGSASDPDAKESSVQNGTSTVRNSTGSTGEALLDYDPLDAEDDGMRNSWRNTTSTIVAPVEEEEEDTHDARLDSPTLPAHLMAAEPQIESLDSTSSKEEKTRRVESYMQSLSRTPSFKSSTVDQSPNVMLLHREIMLLKNDLVYERYIKQQHLSHIGQLRTKHVREATVEAETQNLINVNRGLKSKLEEVRSTMAQTKREAEKSRAHSKKWEAELTSKLRTLKEEQKKWLLESENLNRELASARENVKHMKDMIVASEARELTSQQKMQSIETNHDEIERLRNENSELKTSIRKYEAREVQFENQATEKELAESKVHALELRLASQHSEAEQLRIRNQQEIEKLTSQLETMRTDIQNEQRSNIQPMIDSALGALRGRLVETQKAHSHLLKRFTALEAQYMSLIDSHENDEPLLGGGGIGFFDSNPTSPVGTYSSGYPPMRSRVGTNSGLGTPGSSRDVLNPTARVVHEQGRTGSFDSLPGVGSDTEGKANRIYGREYEIASIRGRGGVQNIAAAKKKEKKKDEDKDKKDKKSTGLRGIRGFVS